MIHTGNSLYTKTPLKPPTVVHEHALKPTINRIWHPDIKRPESTRGSAFRFRNSWGKEKKVRLYSIINNCYNQYYSIPAQNTQTTIPALDIIIGSRSRLCIPFFPFFCKIEGIMGGENRHSGVSCTQQLNRKEGVWDTGCGRVEKIWGLQGKKDISTSASWCIIVWIFSQ